MPLAKKRHRSFLRGGKIASFDPQDKEKRLTKAILEQQMWNLQNSDCKETVMKASNLIYSDRYRIDLTFHMPIPLSFNTAQKKQALWNLIFPTSCDTDNQIKFILDCANEVLYPDDRMISQISAKKLYSNNPRTEINIMADKFTGSEKEMAKILSVYGPDELKLLLADINEFFYLYDMQQKEGWLVEQLNGADFSESRQLRTAYLLSRLAEHHSKLLKKINEISPEFWKHETNEIRAYGKTLC